jgi:hypothetical protein
VISLHKFASSLQRKLGELMAVEIYKSEICDFLAQVRQQLA